MELNAARLMCSTLLYTPYLPPGPWATALPDWAYNLVSSVVFPLDAGCKSSMLQVWARHLQSSTFQLDLSRF
jgi:hypothetical protein